MITQTFNNQISNLKQSLITKFSIIFLIIGIWSLIFTRAAYGASLSVSMSVGLTYFEVQGYTSPNALIYLQESGSTVATGTSQADGSFSLLVSSYDGTYTYTLYALDTSGLTTNSLIMTVALSPGTTTTLGNLILPPSYNHNGLDKHIGEDFDLSGMGVPNSSILLISRNTTTYTRQINSEGHWSLSLSTDALSSGTYDLILKNQLSSGLVSDPTINMVLTLHDRNLATLASPASSPPTTPSITTTPKSLPWWLANFDENQNNRLELSELKYSLTHWFDSWLVAIRSQKTGSCDLNQDGVCDLIDLSILLYYIEH